MTKAIGDFPTIPPQNIDCRNNADAIADVPRILSSNALINSVHTTGNPDLGGSQNAPQSLLSPSGEFGHDHSGGIWGKPFHLSIATISVGASQDFSPNFYGTDPIFNSKVTSLAANTNTTLNIASFSIYNPPCDPLNGAYNALSAHISITVSNQINVISADTIEVKIKNETTDDSVTLPLISGFNTNPTNKHTYSAAAADRLNLEQGNVNHLSISVKFNAHSSSSMLRTCTFQVADLNFFVS